MKKFLIFSVILFTHFMLLAQGNIINVPDDFVKIQDAINSSVDGDTIIVAPGTYFENVNFRGKNVVLTSHYVFDEDVSFINTTIIDGSKPHSTDTASVVIFLSGEDRTAVLQGFTITGGKGTKIFDGFFVRVGGGIVIIHSSPTIRHNIIAFNESINSAGVSFKSGGGIAADNSSAIISNNIIFKNISQDGGGVQLGQNPGSIFMNNIVAYNTNIGRGGVWIRGDQGKFINNTIAFNFSGNSGGIGLAHNPIVNIENCIIYGNTTDSSSPQIFGSGTINITNTNIEGGWEGAGNIDENPLFIEYSPFILQDDSPCVDMGDTSTASNDWEDPDNRGFALSPALSTLRNDMGAYGGNQFQTMPYLNLFDLTKIILKSSTNKTYFLPENNTSVIISSQIINPEGQLVDAKAIIKNIDGSIFDSVSMIDDGSLSDSLANDGIYTAAWTIPNNEKSYSVDIKAFLTDYKQLISKQNTLGFTTKGAIKLESFEITSEDSIPNPGDKIELTLNLKNYGITDTVYNVNLSIIVPAGSCVKNETWGGPTFGDIAPGEIQSNTNRSYILEFADTCSSTHNHEFEILIKSNKTVYWHETLSIDLITGIEDQKSKTPTEFKLYQNYPNPFNPTTTISYNIPTSKGVSSSATNVTLKVYDILGKEVATLVNEVKSTGSYKIEFDASSLPSGIYFYSLQSGGFTETRKLTLLK